MAANDAIFLYSCLDGKQNTGFPSCGLTVGNVKAVYFADMGLSIPAATVTSKALLLAAIKAACIATSKKDRLFPVKTIVNLDADNTGETPMTKEYLN